MTNRSSGVKFGNIYSNWHNAKGFRKSAAKKKNKARSTAIRIFYREKGLAC